MQVKEYALYKGEELLVMKYKVIVYYDNMPDSEHIFSNKNDAINELHRSMGTKREIAEQLGVSASTVGYYGTPVYARRTSDNGRRLIE